jgi:signal peptidase II
MNKVWKYVLVFVLALLADQFLKLYFLTGVSHDWGFVSFHLVKNTGASFGILQGNNMLFIWISLMVLGLLMTFHDQFSEHTYLFLLFITIGLVGNLFDRIRYGFVVDFVDFGFWPVFNVADALISVGVIGVVLFSLTAKEKA